MGEDHSRHERVDWRKIFKKYAGLVGQSEGVLFLYKWEWTREEGEAIEEALGDGIWSGGEDAPWKDET